MLSGFVIARSTTNAARSSTKAKTTPCYRKIEQQQREEGQSLKDKLVLPEAAAVTDIQQSIALKSTRLRSPIHLRTQLLRLPRVPQPVDGL